MKTVVLDSHALLIYFEQEPGWEEVANLLAEGGQETVRLLLSVVNWGEVVYITRRVYGEDKEQTVRRAIDQLPIDLVPVDLSCTIQAAYLKAEGGISYADCFAAGLALEEDGAVATGDPEFERVEDRIEVLWIPQRAEPGA